jgi:hypothetical protein
VGRLLAWISGAAGGLALYGWLNRRRPSALEPGRDPRAAELRAKLEESRPLVEEREAFESGETAVDEAGEPTEPSKRAEPEPADDPEDRRRRVHEQARGAVNEMRRRPR